MGEQKTLVESLILAADIYTLTAVKHLVLDTRIEVPPDLDDSIEGGEVLKSYLEKLNQNPAALTGISNFWKFRALYLFPNLDDADRQLVVSALRSAELSRQGPLVAIWRTLAVNARKNLSTIERKLTAIQMAILDSEMFAIGASAGSEPLTLPPSAPPPS